MADPEQRQYVISGEAPVEDWSLALQILGRLGINAVAMDAAAQNDEDLQAPEGASLEPGTIPYSLYEITSRDQYLCNEHLGEFWPEYRKMVQESGKTPNKSEALCWGLNMLTHPRRRGALHRGNPSQTDYFIKSLGLVIVEPRSLAGFSDEYLPDSYGLWSHEEYGDAVLEVGSFINAARLLAELPAARRPFAISVAETKFFNALADKLEAQIEDSAA